MAPLSLAEPAVRSYILYSGILALKVLTMAVLTGRVRYRKNVFANEEDAKKKKGIVKYDDPDVERVRRAHLNDLENIPGVLGIRGSLPYNRSECGVCDYVVPCVHRGTCYPHIGIRREANAPTIARHCLRYPVSNQMVYGSEGHYALHRCSMNQNYQSYYNK